MKKSSLGPNDSLKGENKSYGSWTRRGQKHKGLKKFSTQSIPERISAKVRCLFIKFRKRRSVNVESLVSTARFVDMQERTPQPLKHTPSMGSRGH